MKYFCPLENVKTINGRNNVRTNGIDAKSTNINGWEIAENGIWAGGKDTKSESSKGVLNLGVFTKNWSIDSDGNIVAKEGTFSDKLSVLGTSFFVEKRTNLGVDLDIIHLDNFELIKNNNTNTLTLFGKHTKSPNESQTIVTVNEEGDSAANCYFQLDYSEGIKVPYLTIKNAKNAIISGDINGYLNLNNNLKLTTIANYLFDKSSFSRTSDGTTYKYTLPNKSGTILLDNLFEDIKLYKYIIEIEKDFILFDFDNDTLGYAKLTDNLTIEAYSSEIINIKNKNKKEDVIYFDPKDVTVYRTKKGDNYTYNIGSVSFTYNGANLEEVKMSSYKFSFNRDWTESINEKNYWGGFKIKRINYFKPTAEPEIIKRNQTESSWDIV